GRIEAHGDVDQPEGDAPFPDRSRHENRPPRGVGTQEAGRSLPMTAVRAIQSFFGPGVHPLFLAVTFLGTSGVLWSLILLYHWLVPPRLCRPPATVSAASLLSE